MDQFPGADFTHTKTYIEHKKVFDWISIGKSINSRLTKWTKGGKYANFYLFILRSAKKIKVKYWKNDTNQDGVGKQVVWRRNEGRGRWMILKTIFFLQQ